MVPKVYIHFKIDERPFGGGLQFLKSFKKYSYSTDKINISESINSEYDIFLINGGYKGPGMTLNISEVKNIRRYGYNNIFGLIFGTSFMLVGKALNIIDKFGYYKVTNSLLGFRK